MKNLFLVLMVVVLTGCASSAINISANIPESQEIDIQISTKSADEQIMDEITGHALELLKIILYICGVFSVYCGLQYMFMADWPMFFFLLPINVVFIYYVKLRLKGEI